MLSWAIPLQNNGKGWALRRDEIQPSTLSSHTIMMQTHPISAHHPQIGSIIWILYVTAVKIVNSYWGRRSSHQWMLGSREPLYFGHAWSLARSTPCGSSMPYCICDIYRHFHETLPAMIDWQVHNLVSLHEQRRDALTYCQVCGKFRIFRDSVESYFWL